VEGMDAAAGLDPPPLHSLASLAMFWRAPCRACPAVLCAQPSAQCSVLCELAAGDRRLERAWLRENAAPQVKQARAGARGLVTLSISSLHVHLLRLGLTNEACLQIPMPCHTGNLTTENKLIADITSHLICTGTAESQAP
jgi:hypothetical protein